MSRRRKSQKRAKRRNREQASAGRRSSTPDRVPIVEFEHPLMSLSPGERAAAIRSIGDSAAATFDSGLERLASLIPRFDPLVLLAFVGAYEIPVAIDRASLTPDPERLRQHQHELLQALCLRTPPTEYRHEPDAMESYVELKTVLRDVSHAWPEVGLRDVKLKGDSQLLSRRVAQERVRHSTFVIRNFGYRQQSERLCRDLFRPISERIAQLCGVRPESLITLLDGMIELGETRLNAFKDRLRPMMRAATSEQAIIEYHAAYPRIDVDAEALTELFRDRGFDVSATKSALLNHNTLRLPSIFEFTVEELQHLVPNDNASLVVDIALREWGIKFGDLAGTAPARLFLDNPVWARPIIRINDSTAFGPSLSTLNSFRIELIESALIHDESVKKAYHDHRAKYLEDEVTRLLVGSLPGCDFWRGSIWKDLESGEQFENDLLLRLDSYAIIVEAKSARVTEPARRGGLDRLERTFKELVQKPTEQANRFERFLRSSGERLDLQCRHGGRNSIDLRGVRHFLRLNVTLAMIADLISRWPEIQEAGWLPESFAGCPTIPLWDLESTLELLEGPCQALHYLRRRTEIEAHVDYQGDELDLLGVYLRGGFNHPGIGAGVKIVTTGMQAVVDPYMMRREHGLPVEKPRLEMSPWWRRLLERVETRRMPRWTELGYYLLNVEHVDQVKLQREFAWVRKLVRKRFFNPHQLNTVVLAAGPPDRRIGLAATAYKDADRNKRYEYMQTAARHAFECSSAEPVVVIAFDARSDHDTYSSIGMFERGNVDSSDVDQL